MLYCTLNFPLYELPNHTVKVRQVENIFYKKKMFWNNKSISNNKTLVETSSCVWQTKHGK